MYGGRNDSPALSEMQPVKVLFASPSLGEAETTTTTTVAMTGDQQQPLKPAYQPGNGGDGGALSTKGSHEAKEMVKRTEEESQARVRITIDRESSGNEGGDNHCQSSHGDDEEEENGAASDDQGSPAFSNAAVVEMKKNKDEGDDESASPLTPGQSDNSDHHQSWSRWLEKQSERVRVYNHGLDALVSKACSSESLQRSASLGSSPVGQPSVWPEWIQIHATTWNMNGKRPGGREGKCVCSFVVSQVCASREHGYCLGQTRPLRTTSRSSSTTTGRTFT